MMYRRCGRYWRTVRYNDEHGLFIMYNNYVWRPESTTEYECGDKVLIADGGKHSERLNIQSESAWIHHTRGEWWSR